MNIKIEQQNITLENFDDVWALGYPKIIEQKLQELVSKAKSLENNSIYVQILSQIALAQALQKNFDQAHQSLDEAERIVRMHDNLGRVRMLLERGRVFQQEENISQARDYFERAYRLAAENQLDYHAINAAHMIAIVGQSAAEKIFWNERAITMSLDSRDSKAQGWLGSLYNNLGQAYLENGQFQKALEAFELALEYRKKEQYLPNIRFAQWSIARVLRSLHKIDEALLIQEALLAEYTKISDSGSLDMPEEMFTLTRGWIYEELSELHVAKSIRYAQQAYNDLSRSDMFRKCELLRLERLKKLITVLCDK